MLEDLLTLLGFGYKISSCGKPSKLSYHHGIQGCHSADTAEGEIEVAYDTHQLEYTIVSSALTKKKVCGFHLEDHNKYVQSVVVVPSSCVDSMTSPRSKSHLDTATRTRSNRPRSLDDPRHHKPGRSRRRQVTTNPCTNENWDQKVGRSRSMALSNVRESRVALDNKDGRDDGGSESSSSSHNRRGRSRNCRAQATAARIENHTPPRFVPSDSKIFVQAPVMVRRRSRVPMHKQSEPTMQTETSATPDCVSSTPKLQEKDTKSSITPSSYQRGLVNLLSKRMSLKQK